MKSRRVYLGDRLIHRGVPNTYWHLLAKVAELGSCWKSGVTMKRLLYGLRFQVTHPSYDFKDLEDPIIIIGFDRDDWPYPPGGKEWWDVRAGDVLIDKDNESHAVIAVRLYIAHGGNPGDQVVSGRDWLKTGRVLSPAS